MTQPIHQTKKRVADGKGKMSAQSEPPVKLFVAMTGKASAAKTALGDEPVFACIASLPQPSLTKNRSGTRGFRNTSRYRRQRAKATNRPACLSMVGRWSRHVA